MEMTKKKRIVMPEFDKNNMIKVAKKIWRQKALFAMLALPMIMYCLFSYVPMTKVTWAFTNLGDVAKSKTTFVGFKNFVELIGTSGFRRAFANTLIISFYNTVFSFPIPIIIALFLNEIQCKWFKKFSQTVIYLPHFLSWAIIGSIFYLLLAPQNSVNAQMANLLNAEPIYFFASLDHIRGILVFTNIWQGAGYGAIVYLAALSGVDQGLYEAATIDGASRFQKMKYISLPCIRPIIVTMLILGLAKVLNIFNQVLVMCTEITYSKVDVIQTYAYRTGIEQMRMGYSMAVSVFKAIISLVLVLSTNAIAKKISDGEEGVF